jgi:hypothetical protein
MPKQSLKIGSFHSGLNTKADARDIKDEELALSDNVSIDKVGKIVMAGNSPEISGTALPTNDTLAGLTKGYGLFRFSSDYKADGTHGQTDYIIVWDDTEGKFYWSADGATFAEAIDLSSTWGSEDNLVPIFYYVDGALRIIDSSFHVDSSNNVNPSIWFGVVDRLLFPDATHPGPSATPETPNDFLFSGWKKGFSELKTPTAGKVSTTIPADTAALETDSVYWHVRNLRLDTTELYDFNVTTSGNGTTIFSSVHSNPIRNAGSGTYSAGQSLYTLTEGYAGTNDENWQTVGYRQSGYKGETYHMFGIALRNENDDHTKEQKWTLGTEFTNTSHRFESGKSLYLAVRIEDQTQRNMWLGTHIDYDDDVDAYAKVNIISAELEFQDTDADCKISFQIDSTKFTDITTPIGQWHILEFPYDDHYNLSQGDAIFLITKYELRVTYAIETKSVEYTNAAHDSWFGQPFLSISDLRFGESSLVGVDTVGRHKFFMSHTYDDKENESRLLDLGEIELARTTSEYQIGITGYHKEPSASFNPRITGSNLYIEDEGIPYRIAELRYLRGLRGSWEHEFPSSSRFSIFDTNNAKSNTVKNNGLPLLESYEAMNGYTPEIESITADFKTSTLLNRRVYAGNVKQNSKTHGDRMIKTVTNNFDSFPSVGREIDVVINDGDEIVALETYADRILQFKKNTMYLINATKSSEYLEDTYQGKGIATDMAVCKTDMGLAWANENGCYFYDGQKVHNISDGLIDDAEWATHIGADTDVMYSPLHNKILVSGGTNGVDVFEFSLQTKGWSKATGKIEATKTNSILDIDDKIKYMTSTKIYNWLDTSSEGFIRILTKDFDFGNPAQRKKCFKFYVTYKSAAASNTLVYFGMNGETLTANSPGGDMKDNSKFAGTNDVAYSTTTGLATTSGEWKQVELKPATSINNKYSVQLHFITKASSTTPSSFEINDITIIYRPKPLK